MGLVRIKSLLVGWHLMIVFTWVPLLTLWSGLKRLLFPHTLAWWEVCSLMSHQVHLNHLGVTCNLFYMMCSRLWWLSKLSDFVWRKLLQIYITCIDGLGNKLFIFEKKPEYISMQDTCCFWWVHSKRHLWLYSIVPLIYRMIACLKFVSRLNLALTSLVCGLQKSSYLAQIASKLRLSGGKHQEIYWSIPKFPLHAMTFLHFLDSGNTASSQSRIFSHFSFYLRNLWYKL